MAETFTTELPDEKTRSEMDKAMFAYRKQISATPALMSLLYDIDLLPEQIRLPVNVTRMIAVCEIFKRLTPAQVSSLFTKTETN